MGQKKYVTLTITENCNLACIYCYEHEKTSRSASFECLKKIIDDEFNKDDQYDEILFDFFGGEPFLEFELIKKAFEYIMKKKTTKKFLCFATTNGTLITKDIEEWLEKNKEFFWCGLSFDGTIKMQNVNRSNSSNQINLTLFKKLWPEQPIKMTISQMTLSSLSEGVIFLHEQGFKVTVNLAFGIDWSTENYKSLLENELLKLMDYYFENPQIEPCSMLDRNIPEITAKKDTVFRWCGAGVHMNSYDITGTRYPCHYFFPVTLGTHCSEKALHLDFSPDIKLYNETCESCEIIQVCQTCYGASYQQFGSRSARDNNLCLLNKIIVKANSLFLWKKIERDGVEFIAHQCGCGVKNLLNAIKIVQNLD